MLDSPQQRQVLVEKMPASPMPPPSMSNFDVGSQNVAAGGDSKSAIRLDTEDMNGKENANFGSSDSGGFI
jgi:hypothetical protein